MNMTLYYFVVLPIDVFGIVMCAIYAIMHKKNHTDEEI